jgi:hypothetical protein
MNRRKFLRAGSVGVAAAVAPVSAPRQLVVYADSRHSVGGVPAANLGPFPSTLMADWLAARIAGKGFASERQFIDGTGRIAKTTFA